MIISEKSKFLFVSNAKASTHTMYSYLTEHYDGKRLTTQGHYHPLPSPTDYPDVFRWSVVRDPFSRAVSAYFGAVVLSRHSAHWRRVIGSPAFIPFCRWLASGAWVEHTAQAIRPQFHRLDGANLDTVIRFESLQDGVASLPFAKSPAPELPHCHAGDYGAWSDWYEPDGEAADCIRIWAKDDFIQYGYSLEVSA